MIRLYALGRLLWRPATLALLFPVILASSLAFFLPLWGQSIAAGAEAELLTPSALWRFAVLMPAAVGVALSLVVNEARHTALAWTMPRYGAALLAGKAFAGAIVAVSVGVLAVRMIGSASGFSALGVALLCFSLGSFWSDPLTPKPQSHAVLLTLAIPVLRPEYLERAAASAPLLFTALGGVAFVLLHRREFSTALARQRPFVATATLGSPSPSGMRGYWQGRPSMDSEWTLPLWKDGLGAWVRAAHYEAYGGRSLGYLTMFGFQFVFIGGFAYFLGAPLMVAYIPAIGAAWGSLQLRGKFLYPLARNHRAALAYCTSLFEVATICGFAAITLAALYAFGVTVEPDRPEKSFRAAIPLVLFIFALAPIGQVGTMGSPPLNDSASARLWLRVSVPLFAWLISAMLSYQAFVEFGLFASIPFAVRLALIGVLAATTQAIYWFVLRWYYAKRDLVFLPR